MIGSAVLVFLLTFGTDWVWVAYVRAAAAGKVARASIASAALVLFGSLATIACVDDHRMIPIACAGALAGTYACMRATKP